MQQNSIQRFFENINITYNDLPYLYIPLFVVIGLVFAAWWLWGENAVLWGILILSTYLILATQFHLYRSTKKDLVDQQKKIQAYFTLYSMIDFEDVLPYMTSWSATPELALTTYEEIRHNKPNRILELGSGISTIIASYALQQNNKGSILSLDHNEIYAQKTRDQLKDHKVEDFAQVKYCPLITYEIGDSNWQWYNLEGLDFTNKFDLLLIDGPPVKTNKSARFPALPILTEQLSEQATIIIHDAHRPSEQNILAKWKKQFPEFNCEIKDTEKGVAILRR